MKAKDETSRIRIQDPDPNPDPLVRGMDPRIGIGIRIHPKMSWIRITASKVRERELAALWRVENVPKNS